MIIVRGIIHLEMPTGRETQRDYSFGSIYPPRQNVKTLLSVEGVLKCRSSQINDSIKSLFFWGKYLCLHLFKVVVYCSIPINIHDLDLLLEGKKKKKALST